jgi:hypothetical protein
MAVKFDSLFDDFSTFAKKLSKSLNYIYLFIFIFKMSLKQIVSSIFCFKKSKLLKRLNFKLLTCFNIKKKVTNCSPTLYWHGGSQIPSLMQTKDLRVYIVLKYYTSPVHNITDLDSLHSKILNSPTFTHI